MAVVGTKLYNSDYQQIYPESDASVIVCNGSGDKSTVEEDVKKLYKQISDLTGSTETINNIIVKVAYQPSDTNKESDIKLSQKEWSDTFEMPTEENPYVWKRTTYTYKGAESDTGTIIYEIVASDVSVIIQTIYTRTQGVTPVIEYKQKVDEQGRPLYVDSEGRETTTVTGTKAYDYDYYWDGSKANSMNNLPPTPDDQAYTWTDYPQDISLSFTSVFMSRRIRQQGKWGPFSTPAQYGQWPNNTEETT